MLTNLVIHTEPYCRLRYLLGTSAGYENRFETDSRSSRTTWRRGGHRTNPPGSYLTSLHGQARYGFPGRQFSASSEHSDCICTPMPLWGSLAILRRRMADSSYNVTLSDDPGLSPFSTIILWPRGNRRTNSVAERSQITWM